MSGIRNWQIGIGNLELVARRTRGGLVSDSDFLISATGGGV